MLAFEDNLLVDGDGPDLLVFENPFGGWTETGAVAASIDGEAWHEWPCDPDTGHGCAGIEPVHAHPDTDLDPTDPSQAGGDAFDLADLGLEEARYLRIRDTGGNEVMGISGGFDLDAVAAVLR